MSGRRLKRKPGRRRAVHAKRESRTYQPTLLGPLDPGSCSIYQVKWPRAAVVAYHVAGGVETAGENDMPPNGPVALPPEKP
jgi:hypothetical protein